MHMRTVPAVLAVSALCAAACGGGGGAGSPNAPTPTVPADPATTITITTAGVTPKRIEVPVGTRVTFVNNDTSFHEMSSDPHPVHTDCPEMRALGAQGPGTSRQTSAFTSAKTCTYHDHGQETNTALHGTIVVR